MIHIVNKSERKKEVPSYEIPVNRHLVDLYKSDDTGCRIASIRRRYLFAALGIEEEDPKNPPQSPKWAHLFHHSIRGLSPERLRDITGEETELGALIRISNNYEYVRILGKDDYFAQKELNKFESQPVYTANELKEKNQILNGLKTFYSSPITAAYGGTYNQSLRNFENLQKIQSQQSFLMVYQKGGWDYKANLSSDLLENHIQQCLALLARLRLREQIETDDSNLPPVPWPPSDGELDYFIRFLKEHRSLRSEVDNRINDLRIVSRTADTWQGYLDATRSLKRECNRLQRIQRWAGRVEDATKKAITAAYGAYVFNPGTDMSLQEKLLAAGLGFLAFETLYKPARDALENKVNQIYQPKMQLITNLEQWETFKQL